MWEVRRGVAPIWVPAPYCVQASGGMPSGDTVKIGFQGPHARNPFAEGAKAFQNLLP